MVCPAILYIGQEFMYLPKRVPPRATATMVPMTAMDILFGMTSLLSHGQRVTCKIGAEQNMTAEETVRQQTVILFFRSLGLKRNYANPGAYCGIIWNGKLDDAECSGWGNAYPICQVKVLTINKIIFCLKHFVPQIKIDCTAMGA